MTDFKQVLLTDIEADPNQPRQIFDDIAMAELADSVRENGVVQPILLRPSTLPGNRPYQIVFGERRFRAAVVVSLNFKGRDTIPAVIRELSDDEALELQIIENLQRKDVHPMEEGVAFKSLQDRKGWSVQEIANRVGKKDFYIRQRLRLTDLIKLWQTLFYHGALTLTDALRVCVLAPADQNSLYEGEDIDKEDLKNPGFKVEFSDWDFNQFKGNLSAAAFDLDDPYLDKKMGACNNCKYNTGAALLFPTSAGTSRCTNTVCFKNKTQKSFDLRLKVSAEDPTMLFVSTSYNDHVKEIATLTKEHGIEVIGYGGFSALEEPEKPDYDQWLEDEGDYPMTDKETHQAWQRHLAGFQEELSEYNRKVAGGKYKKALVVVGDDKGRIVYVSLNKKSNSSLQPKKNAADVKEAISSGEATLSDVTGEISRINTNLENAAELDAEKVHLRIMGQYKLHPAVTEKLTTALVQPEWICLRWYILDQAGLMGGYGGDDKVEKVLGLAELDFYNSQERPELWSMIENLTEKQFALVFRFLMAKKFAEFSPRKYGSDKAFVMRKMAESLADIPIASYEAEQGDKAAKRKANADKELKKLEAKKTELLHKKTPKKVRGKKTSKISKDIEALVDQAPEPEEFPEEDPE